MYLYESSCRSRAAVLVRRRLDFSILTGELHIRTFCHFIGVIDIIDPENEKCEQTNNKPHQEQVDQIDQNEGSPFQILLVIKLTQASE